MAHTNTHELDARMNLMIYSNAKSFWAAKIDSSPTSLWVYLDIINSSVLRDNYRLIINYELRGFPNS